MCRQCTAKSKRSGLQCRACAIKDSPTHKCRTHGGVSTGPKSQVGRDRIAAAHLVHGRETRTVRAERRLALVRLADLDLTARVLGLISGPKTRGPKPGFGIQEKVGGTERHRLNSKTASRYGHINVT
jgi:hypothetical protein